MAHIVTSSNHGQGFTFIASGKRLAFLMLGQLRLPTKPDTFLHRSFPTFGRSGSDQAAFKLSKSTKNGQHEPTMRACSIRPRVTRA